MATSLPSSSLRPVLRKVICGVDSTEKKSPERRWLSRSLLRVSTELSSIVAETEESSGCSAIVEGALELAELAADLADEVADGEADLGVAGVDDVGAGDEALELWCSWCASP